MEKPVLKYPIGIQSFSEIREKDYLYIDKTKDIYQLISTGKYYFLSRPRRFGKSLLLSTIKSYFEGRKDLFDGLYISDKTQSWDSHPVLLLSLSGYDPNLMNLYAILDSQISDYEREYGRLIQVDDLGMRFRNVIRAAYEKTGKQVVVLVDEYDAPMMYHLHEYETYEKLKGQLKSIYVNLKDMDDYIQFGMLTGITRFSKMTIFSGLNNLKDISLDDRYGEICGITEDELRLYFHEGITKLASALEVNTEDAMRMLKEQYDGYHFTSLLTDIYNPFSLLVCLDSSRIGSYWFQTATPTLLINEILKRDSSIPKLLNQTVSSAVISDIDTYRTTPLTLLFQSGYLTIKEYDRRRDRYLLGLPNKEVEQGLFTRLLSHTTDWDANKVDESVWDIRDAFEEGDADKALTLCKIFLAGIPANVTQSYKELYFENNLFMLLRLVGMDARAEWWSSHGRIDILLTTHDYIYIMELKLDSSPTEALEQIDKREYPLQFETDGRKIVKIGINFSSDTRNIQDWKIDN